MTSNVELKARFKKLYPEHAAELEKAQSDEEIHALQQKWIQDRKDALIHELTVQGKRNLLDERMLNDTDKTVTVTLTEDNYRKLINARGGEIQNELVAMFDGVERLKDMGSQDPEVVTYAMVNAGLAALGISMATALIAELLSGLGLATAIFTALSAASFSVVGAVIDIIVLAVIPIIYFMVKPAACIFAVVNELQTDLVIQDESIVHGKVNVRTETIPGALKLTQFICSAGIWSTQKRDAALIGTQYGVRLKQVKGIQGIEPDGTTFSIGVECPLASGSNSCAVAIDKSANDIAKEADAHLKQDISCDNGKYGMEMHCNSGSGSLAYYVCRIFRK